MLGKIKEQLEKTYDNVSYWKSNDFFIWFEAEDDGEDIELKVEISHEDHDWYVYENRTIEEDNWERKGIISL
jgi:hypothetical protein